MTDEQFNRLLAAIEKHSALMVNIHGILAATVVLQKIDHLPDAGGQATLEMLCDYFTTSAKGEPMKPIPRPDKLEKKS